ncbi:hypothetical protein C8R47DRAFT_1317136 [Mycena vitilis]|nr:hypothetical protein C8R47DRAFT_1317136 [Mycena vitilis]
MAKANSKRTTRSDAANGSGAVKTPRTRDRWTGPMLGIMLRVFVSEKELGRQMDNGCYDMAVVALHAAGVERSRQQVKSCWTRTKGQYMIMKEMLGLPGFGLDPKTRSVTAPDQVWDAYLVAKHKKHKTFRNRPFPYFSEVALLCDDGMATGEDTFLNEAPDGDQTQDLLDRENNLGTSAGGYDGDDEEDGDEDENAPRDVHGSTSNDSRASSSPLPKAWNAATLRYDRLGSRGSRYDRTSNMSVLAELASSVGTLASAPSAQEESSKSGCRVPCASGKGQEGNAGGGRGGVRRGSRSF